MLSLIRQRVVMNESCVYIYSVFTVDRKFNLRDGKNEMQFVTNELSFAVGICIERTNVVYEFIATDTLYFYRSLIKTLYWLT